MWFTAHGWGLSNITDVLACAPALLLCAHPQPLAPPTFLALPSSPSLLPLLFSFRFFSFFPLPPSLAAAAASAAAGLSAACSG